VWKLRVKQLIIPTIILLAILAVTPVNNSPPQEPVNKILYPRIGCPALVIQGGTFKSNILLPEDAKLESASLSSEIGSITLEIIDEQKLPNGTRVLTLKVPPNSEPALYSLELKASKAESTLYFKEPNSVAVIKEFKEEFTVIVFTDLHWGIMPIHDATRKNFENFILQANFLRPDFIISCGDNIDATDNEETFQLFTEEVSKLIIPTFFATGNNDDYAEEAAGLYTKYIAPLDYVLNYGNYTFIFLHADTGYIGSKRLKWLEETLAKATNYTMRILVEHYPYWEPGDLLEKDAKELDRIVREYNVQLVLTGHIHKDQVKIQDGTRLQVTAALGKGSTPYFGYRIFTFSNGTLKPWYNDKPIPINGIQIVFLNRNDGKAYASIAKLTNNLEIPVNGTLRLRIRDKGVEPIIEGGTVVKTYRHGGKLIIDLSITLNPGESKTVKAYYEKDEKPPKVTVKAPSKTTKGASFTITIEAVDDEWGVSKVKLFYSTDNKSWVEAPVKLKGEKYIVTLNISQPIFYYVEVEDAAGNKAVSQVKTIAVETPEKTPEQKPTETIKEKPTLTVTIIAIIALVAVIAVLAILKLKK